MEEQGWSSEMALGVPAMDNAHRAFVAELNRLASAPDDRFAAGFHALIASMERDFREEEELMEAIGFPGVQAHSEQHARVLGGMHHAASRVMEGDLATGRGAVEFLQQWFRLHLSTMDLALAVAIDLNDAEDSALQASRTDSPSPPQTGR